MAAATSTGVRVRHEAAPTTITTPAIVTHEIVVTTRLLVFWKQRTLDAITSGGDVGSFIKKRVACEEHLERLLATLDEVCVLEQVRANDQPANKTAANTK